jgi:predicted PurR-regulated permease PerM
MRPEVVRLAWIVAVVAVTVLLQRLASVLVPFCAAALLAYLCAPFVAWCCCVMPKRTISSVVFTLLE